MTGYKAILKRYWGYDDFRPMQEEVIRSVLEGRDTLALMPTGGGKSLTYQVPGLMLDGTCLVVTPLIALMKDQVSDLKRRGISAEALYTGMDKEAFASIVNKCIYHRVDFLYVSPERLASPGFRDYLKQMPVSLIAVDEAHCISQWGYDFRPSYLRVAEAREFFEGVPVLALTATATPEVVEDIQARLQFREPHVLSRSFRRENLAYVTRECGNKALETCNILARLRGSAIVYVRRRDTAETLSAFLNEEGIAADFYHAGLSLPRREQRQEAWKSGRVPVIVATNAFGMGIDKPDVRVVVHHDIPDGPEAYFQEAGRAGRDGQRAYAVLLHDRFSLAALQERVTRGFPKKEQVRRVYAALSDHFSIPEGGGNGMAFEFDLGRFVTLFKLNRAMVRASIEILTVAGYLECTTAVNARPRVTIIVPRDRLYEMEQLDPATEQVLVLLMRRYPGIFVQDAFIDEDALASELNIDTRKLHEAFLTLSRRKIIRYIPGDDNPYIVYHMPRFPVSYLTFDQNVYEKRKRAFARRIAAMSAYIEERHQCRQLYLLAYFGQQERERCGICDTCLAAKKRTGLDDRTELTNRVELDAIILRLLSEQELGLRELTRAINADPEQILARIRLLLDEELISYVSFDRLRRLPSKGPVDSTALPPDED